MVRSAAIRPGRPLPQKDRAGFSLGGKMKTYMLEVVVTGGARMVAVKARTAFDALRAAVAAGAGFARVRDVR